MLERQPNAGPHFAGSAATYGVYDHQYGSFTVYCIINRFGCCKIFKSY